VSPLAQSVRLLAPLGMEVSRPVREWAAGDRGAVSPADARELPTSREARIRVGLRFRPVVVG
jgi:hypothetical protein